MHLVQFQGGVYPGGTGPVAPQPQQHQQPPSFNVQPVLVQQAQMHQLSGGLHELEMGDKYSSGQGVPRDPVSAYRWYTQAAGQGNAEAHWRLVVCYSSGDGTEQSEQRALHACHQAATMGHVAAMCFLGDCYLRGRYGAQQNVAVATAWFEKAAHLGDPTAQNNVGICCTNAATIDWGKAIMWWRRSAEAGNPNAQYNLGLVYAHGRNVGKSLETAAELFESAEGSQPKAMYEMALCQARGWGLPVDLAAAESRAMRAAQAGHAPASCLLAELYEKSGRGFEEIVSHLVKADAGSVAVASVNLGICYAQGWGCAQDWNAAAACFHRAAQAGLAGGIWRWGHCLLYGLGVRPRVDAAYGALAHAAEFEDAEAWFRLGAFLVDHPPPKAAVGAAPAAVWLERAGRAGHAAAAAACGWAFRRGAVGAPEDHRAADAWAERADELATAQSRVAASTRSPGVKANGEGGAPAPAPRPKNERPPSPDGPPPPAPVTAPPAEAAVAALRSRRGVQPPGHEPEEREEDVESVVDSVAETFAEPLPELWKPFPGNAQGGAPTNGARVRPVDAAATTGAAAAARTSYRPTALRTNPLFKPYSAGAAATPKAGDGGAPTPSSVLTAPAGSPSDDEASPDPGRRRTTATATRAQRAIGGNGPADPATSARAARSRPAGGDRRPVRAEQSHAARSDTASMLEWEELQEDAVTRRERYVEREGDAEEGSDGSGWLNGSSGSDRDDQSPTRERAPVATNGNHRSHPAAAAAPARAMPSAAAAGRAAAASTRRALEKSSSAGRHSAIAAMLGGLSNPPPPPPPSPPSPRAGVSARRPAGITQVDTKQLDFDRPALDDLGEFELLGLSPLPGMTLSKPAPAPAGYPSGMPPAPGLPMPANPSAAAAAMRHEGRRGSWASSHSSSPWLERHHNGDETASHARVGGGAAATTSAPRDDMRRSRSMELIQRAQPGGGPLPAAGGDGEGPWWLDRMDPHPAGPPSVVGSAAAFERHSGRDRGREGGGYGDGGRRDRREPPAHLGYGSPAGPPRYSMARDGGDGPPLRRKSTESIRRAGSAEGVLRRSSGHEHLVAARPRAGSVERISDPRRGGGRRPGERYPDAPPRRPPGTAGASLRSRMPADELRGAPGDGRGRPQSPYDDARAGALSARTAPPQRSGSGRDLRREGGRSPSPYEGRRSSGNPPGAAAGRGGERRHGSVERVRQPSPYSDGRGGAPGRGAPPRRGGSERELRPQGRSLSPARRGGGDARRPLSARGGPEGGGWGDRGGGDPSRRHGSASASARPAAAHRVHHLEMNLGRDRRPAGSSVPERRPSAQDGGERRRPSGFVRRPEDEPGRRLSPEGGGRDWRSSAWSGRGGSYDETRTRRDDRDREIGGERPMIRTSSVRDEWERRASGGSAPPVRSYSARDDIARGAWGGARRGNDSSRRSPAPEGRRGDGGAAPPRPVPEGPEPPARRRGNTGDGVGRPSGERPYPREPPLGGGRGGGRGEHGREAEDLRGREPPRHAPPGPGGRDDGYDSADTLDISPPRRSPPPRGGPAPHARPRSRSPYGGMRAGGGPPPQGGPRGRGPPGGGGGRSGGRRPPSESDYSGSESDSYDSYDSYYTDEDDEDGPGRAA